MGAKWLFLDETNCWISVSTAPAVTFNTVQRSVDRGTVFTLPVEVGKTVGPVDLYAEFGRDFFESGTDMWFCSVSVKWGFHERWTVASELYGISTYDFDDSELLINGGLRFALKENLLLMISVGVPVHKADTDPTRSLSYAGVQWLF